MAMVSVRHYLIFVGLLLAVCLQPSVAAWSNGGYSADPANPDYGTHDWIAENALTIQTKDVTFLSSTYHAKFLMGTEAPDNPAYIGDSTNHHVYYYSGGSLQDGAGASRASNMYQTALDYLIADDDENAAYYIGAMAHYIADVGVFGHTMGSSTDWGAEVYHSEYENEFESRLSSISLPSTSLGNQDAYSATTGLASKITFGSGTIKSNTWMDSNYDWTDSVFRASAMASLYASVASVAAAINHLLIEASSSTSTPPTISISLPTSSSTYSTGSSTVNLSGTASDDVGVTSVTWSNAANGGSGTASGTTSWSITGISLKSGSNLITVTAHDADGGTGIDTITVTFTQSGELIITASASKNSGTKPLSISFTCSQSGGVPPFTYSWTFGDEGTSTQQNPTHIYNRAGTFTANVTVTDSASNSKQWTTTITVTEPRGAGILSSEMVLALIIIVVAVIAVFVFVIILRKKVG